MRPLHICVRKLAQVCGAPLAAFLFLAMSAQAQLPGPQAQGKTYKPQVDHWHNDDGSTRYNFELSGGPASGVGSTRRYQTFGGVVAGAAGINFNRYITLQGRGEFAQFGVPGPLLYSVAQPDGKVQIGSGTANMLLRYYVGPHARAYIILGGGYYRRVTRFETPTNTSTSGSTSVLTGTYYMNTYGEAAGFGFEWKPSFYSNMKIFTEARYNFIHGQNSDSTTGGAHMDFNSRNAQYIPVLLGLRW